MTLAGRDKPSARGSYAGVGIGRERTARGEPGARQRLAARRRKTDNTVERAAGVGASAVVGAGVMGSGIAQVLALAGIDVDLVDVERGVLDRAVASVSSELRRQVAKGKLTETEASAALSRIRPSTDLRVAAGAGVVVEAATEDVGLKLDIFANVGEIASSDAILASNTSAISITRLASAVPRPDRVIGMHFMNPVPVMQLVEVIRGLQTSDATADHTTALCRDLGKTPVTVNDYPGFVSNRVLMPMINEAVYCVMEGVAEPGAVDQIMKLGMAHPMGPLRLADLIGLDVCLAILKVLQRDLGDPKYRPCPLLARMVAAGRLGRKSGQGFHDYGAKELSPAAARARQAAG